MRKKRILSTAAAVAVVVVVVVTIKSKNGTMQTPDAKKVTNNYKIIHVVTVPTNNQRKQSCLAIVQNYPLPIPPKMDAKKKQCPITTIQGREPMSERKISCLSYTTIREKFNNTGRCWINICMRWRICWRI